MEKRFEVKRFLFETTRSEAVCRFMLTDRLFPMLVPNQYIEMKSVNKLGTGKSHAYKLCVFLNFLHEKHHAEYDAATNKQVLDFIDYLIYGDRENLIILHPQDSLCYSTLSGYVSAITDFYRWLDQTYGSEMTFYEGERKCRHALFAYRREILIEGVWRTKNTYSVASWPYVSYQFKEICKRYGVRDEDGYDYVVTSHQFRHNGITDRLRAGFTLPQIAEMTAHHGTAMIYSSYAHLDLFPETIVEPMQYQIEAESPYMLFAGRILNMDAITEARLLKNIRAHRVPGGICADVTHCKSGLWSCIDCKNFVPEVEQLPYFKEQVAAWEEKVRKFQSDKQMADNFADIAAGFAKIVEKLESGCYNGR